MNFLKQLGSIVLKVTQIATGIAPLIGGNAQTQRIEATTINDLTAIGSIIAQVEAMGQALQLSGTQKLTAAGPLVAQIVLKSELLANRKIADEAAFTKACNGLASDMADLLNSLHGDVQTVNKA